MSIMFFGFVKAFLIARSPHLTAIVGPSLNWQVVDSNPENATLCIDNTENSIGEVNAVEFRLLYEGQLKPSGGSNSRAREKHEIRRAFHPQLRRLWLTYPQLRRFAEHKGRMAYANEINSQHIENPPELSTDDAIQKAFAEIGSNWSGIGYQCVPLATQQISLKCSLDILLLRPEEDRFIFTQGDIDGQVKTLFDALRIPKDRDEAGGSAPGPDETPFFCLLEDDRLISEVRVAADRLLLLPHERKVTANDAFAVISVTISHKIPGMFDQWFT